MRENFPKKDKNNKGKSQSYTRQHDIKHPTLLEIKKLTEKELQEFSIQDLSYIARRLGAIGSNYMTYKTLLEVINKKRSEVKDEINIKGVLERLPDGFGFLRFPFYDYTSGPDDIYVSPSQIRRFNLRTGDVIEGLIRIPKEGEKYFALQKVNEVNHAPAERAINRPNFDRLTPLHPNERFKLETESGSIGTRIMDIFTPIGKGQRGIIVAPPKAGKTVLLKEIAKSLISNHKNIHLIVLLIDERPEEVEDMKQSVHGKHVEVISSTFDETQERHVQVTEIILEKAKRLVEQGEDVVILLDSINRLARAYNATIPASGKVLTGGIDANALQLPKRVFGAARNAKEGGSLTIIATALVETGSRMDEVIYEEFKGTGNMELHLTRKLSNRRIYPAFDLLISGTRRDDLLLSEEELNHAWILHKFLSSTNIVEGMECIIGKMKKFKTNELFLESLKKDGNGNGKKIK